MSFNYKPSKYILTRVKLFADERLEGSENLYRLRGESKAEKMRIDLITGALGEYAVYNYFKSLGLKCSRPDLKIYNTRKKSYDADLKAENFSGEKVDVHVKSQTKASVKRYNQSWLFQRKDKLVSDPRIDEIMVFTNVCEKTWGVSIVGFVHPRLVSRFGLWGECKVPFYQKTKVAIYLEDLIPYGIVQDNFYQELEVFGV